MLDVRCSMLGSRVFSVFRGSDPRAKNDQTEALTTERKMNFIQVKLVSRLTNSYNVARLNL